MNSFIDEDRDDKTGKLNPRQKEVLILVAKGVKYKDIAIRLGVAERTVKYYMKRILGALHAENRSQAVKCAIQEGLVD